MMGLGTVFYNFEHYSRTCFEVPRKHYCDDIILASFPKSGNTWFRFLLSNIVAKLSNYAKGEVDFHTIRFYAPEIRGNRDLTEAVRIPGCPTFLKTHFGLTPGLNNYKSVVLFRDPGKTLLSYKDYLEKEKSRKFRSLDNFIRHWRYGIHAWCAFHHKWLKSNATLFIQYEEAISRPEEILEEMFRYLGYSINRDCIALAVKKSSRENMRRLLMERGDPMARNNRYEFVREGKTQSRGRLTPGQRDYINKASQSVLKKLQDRRLCIRVGEVEKN